ncbi:MAG: hypothetical protein IJK58_05810, partial [Clostridia bacterium]|nr:hypothetical protein [Clostridia bacterium]
MKKITAITMILAMLLSIMAVGASAQVTADQDPIPANIGILTSVANPNISGTNIDVSYVSQFPYTVGDKVGAHGGHETRIVRTTNGTYATFITNATGEATSAHPNWVKGVATFCLIKVSASGFQTLLTAECPQANGSCAPNVLFDGDHTIYVTIITNNLDDSFEAGTNSSRNSCWLEVYEFDINTDQQTAHKKDVGYHTTDPYLDHGYGYSQPILDPEHGKMYLVTNGGEAPGYICWWTYNLNTHRFNTTTRTIQRFSRRCYINGYPDGNGGFTMIIQRCAPLAELGAALGCSFSTTGYGWDALYIMHVPNPDSTNFQDVTICEPKYIQGEVNDVASVSHYGQSGCSYLDDQNRIHVIYTSNVQPNGTVTKYSGAYHAIYDLQGNKLYNQLIPTTLLKKNGASGYQGPDGFAMTQGSDGTYYVFILKSYATATYLGIWSSPKNDGKNFTCIVNFTRSEGISLKKSNGNAVGGGSKPIIANTRNRSVIDGRIGLMFNSGDTFYYFSVKVDDPQGTHTHSYTPVVTPATCTTAGYTTYTCAGCGDSYTADETPALGHNFTNWTETTPAGCTTGGVETGYCSRCTATTTRPTSALGHNYVPNVTQATCTTGGYTTYVCSRCNDSYTDTETPALGHNFTNWTETTPADCTTGGVETGYCSRCTATTTRPTDPLGHNYVPTVTPATCTGGGYTTHVCSRCNDWYIDSQTGPLGHDFTNWTETTPAGCTTGGVETGYCSRCTETTTRPTDPLGHNYSATVVPATYTAGGYTLHECSRCGDSYTDNETEPLAQNVVCSGSLVLSDSIDIRIYVNNVTADMVANGCYVKYSDDGGETFTTGAFNNASSVSDCKYVFTVASFAANELTKPAIFKVCDASGGEIQSITYCVKDYCDAVLDDPASDAKLKTVCSALVAYGYYAQQRFRDTASDAIDISGYGEYGEAVAAVGSFNADLSGFKASTTYVAPVTKASVSLSLESRTVLKFYLKGVSSAEGVSATVGGEPWANVTYAEGKPYADGTPRCCVSINGLNTVDLTEQIVLTYNGTVISYSPMTYVKTAVKNGTADSDVCKALYLFVDAAREYFKSLSDAIDEVFDDIKCSEYDGLDLVFATMLNAGEFTDVLTDVFGYTASVSSAEFTRIKNIFNGMTSGNSVFVDAAVTFTDPATGETCDKTILIHLQNMSAAYFLGYKNDGLSGGFLGMCREDWPADAQNASFVNNWEYAYDVGFTGNLLSDASIEAWLREETGLGSDWTFMDDVCIAYGGSSTVYFLFENNNVNGTGRTIILAGSFNVGGGSATDPLEEDIDDKLDELGCVAHGKIDFIFGGSGTLCPDSDHIANSVPGERGLEVALSNAFGYPATIENDDLLYVRG